MPPGRPAEPGVEVWWELAQLIAIMLLGHWLEMRAVGQASGALATLAALLPDETELVTAEGTRPVPAAGLAVGGLVLVRSGGRVPADGTVVAGYPGARNSSIAATATTSRATAASLGSTVTKASACSRVTARYSASLSVSQSC